MLLLTGATGTVGTALLGRLTGRGTPVRCLVRDPKRLGAQRVRVQLSAGDLADPRGFRNALRGVDAVVHLAAARRDQPTASLEELTTVATWRLLRAAERAGVGHFVFLSPLGASAQSPARLLRAKAAALDAVRDAQLPTTVLHCAAVYDVGRAAARTVGAAAAAGAATRSVRPIWSGDVADAILAALDAPPAAHAEHVLAGPWQMSVRELATALGWTPRLTVPPALARRALDANELLFGPAARLTWSEVEALGAAPPPSAAPAEVLGVRPRTVTEVVGR